MITIIIIELLQSKVRKVKKAMDTRKCPIHSLKTPQGSKHLKNYKQPSDPELK
jgi:hypothetical protein